MDKDILMLNINKVHTTTLGITRIKKNLMLDNIDVCEYIKNKIMKKDAIVYKNGKNFYCKVDNIIITINSFSYTIITAHME